MAKLYGWDYNKVLAMPENIVNMYLREIFEEEVIDKMNRILSTSGEDGLKNLSIDHPLRKKYLSLRKVELETEKKEHEEILKQFSEAKG